MNEGKRQSAQREEESAESATRLCRSYNADLNVTGKSTLGQVQESLRRYMGRMHYVQKSLYQLFRHTQGLAEPKEDLIDVSDGIHHIHSNTSVNESLSITLVSMSCSILILTIYSMNEG